MANEKRIAELIKELKELDVDVNIVTPESNETKGIVGGVEEETEKGNASLVMETADTGKGFQIYRDYKKFDEEDKEKFKRLAR
ncbi:MAG: hypothetical protein ACTSXD_05055 [Candidatus Heimdallarchaeaceae archaeon]